MPEMIEPQEKLSGEQPSQPNTNYKATFFEKALPISIGWTVAIGFGPWLYKSIGEATGWRTDAIATFVAGTLVVTVVGGLLGGASQLVIDSFGKEVKG